MNRLATPDPRTTINRLLAAACACGFALTLAAPPAAAAPASAEIVLPGASSTEGVAVGRGATFFAGELFGGDIFRGNLQRGTVERVVDAPPGRMAVGLKSDDSSGLVYVAGGATGQGYVYNPNTGATVASYTFGTPPNSFINDVVVTRDGAWFTDSLQAKVYFVPISPTGAPGTFTTLSLLGPAAVLGGDFNINGIAAMPNGQTLIVGHSGTNALYAVDSGTGMSTKIMDIAGPDGLLYQAGRLWVAQPFSNQLAKVRLSRDLASGVVQRVYTSSLFQIPTTLAIHGSSLVAVNAKFDTGFPPTADEYEVVIVHR